MSKSWDLVVKKYMNSNQSIKKNTVIDLIFKTLFLLASIISASMILIVIIQITARGVRPFFDDYGTGETLNFFKFITGTNYVGYRIGYIIVDTLYVVFLSILVTAPIAVLTALFIAKMAPKPIGNILNTIIEVLAAIPSVIYGVFGSGIIVVWVRNLASLFGITTAGGLSVLSSVIVLSMMILPTVTMLSITAIRSVPKDIEHGSLALGASPIQTMFRIDIKAALPGIFSGVILGVGRALGEATAVSLVSGQAGSGPSFSLFDTTRTLTSTILMGLKETSGKDYDVRFTIGMVLIFVILITNLALNAVKKRIGRNYGK